MEEQISSPPAHSTIIPPAPRDFQAIMEERIPPAPAGSRIRTPTLRDLMAVIFRHKALIVLSFLGIFLGVVVVTYILPKQYETHIKIMVNRERSDPVVTSSSNAPTLITQDVTQEDLNSEVELLKSCDLLEKVVVTCRLYNLERDSILDKVLGLFASSEEVATAQGLRIPRAVRSLEKKLEVEPVAKSKMIDVRYHSQDPQMAARVLETLSALYLEKHLAVHRPPGALDFFEHQAGQYQKSMATAEQQLAQFARDEGVVSIDLEKDITLHQISESEAQLRLTRADQAAAEQRIHSLKSQLATTPARVTTLVRTADNPQLLEQMQSTLLNLKLKRTELLTKFEPSYGLVQEVDQQIAQTREALAQAEENSMRDETTDLDRTHAWLQEELARARAELATLKARSGKFAADVEAYRESARQLSAKEIAHEDLAREAKTAEENYLLYLRKQEEARISNELDRKRIVNAAIAEAATVPAFPSSPNWLLNLALGLGLAFMTSLGLAFAADYMDATFRTPDEVESFLGIPVLAAIPRSSQSRIRSGRARNLPVIKPRLRYRERESAQQPGSVGFSAESSQQPSPQEE
jgi:uncharacterized protein involved in exopolysaccharide biosynthesis